VSEDIHIFSEENLLRQIEQSEYCLGYYKVRFYTKGGMLSERKTDVLSDFYLYPSGGTLRDENFNIVFYSSRFDTYRGYYPPHKRNG